MATIKKNVQFETTNPLLDDDVHVKDYGGIDIPLTEQEKNTRIPEPEFIPPPFQFHADPNSDDDSPKSSKVNSSESDGFSLNPQADEVSDEERDAQAKQMANAALDVYSFLHRFPNDLIKFDKDKINDLANDGKINLNARIPIDDIETTIARFIDLENERVDGQFYVSKEFRDAVTPPLVRILKKKGAGLTDEQLILFLVIKDITEKGFQFKALWTAKKKTLDQLMIISERLNKTGSVGGNVKVDGMSDVATPPPPPTASSSSSKEDSSNNQKSDSKYTTTNVRNDGTTEEVVVIPVNRGSGRGRPKRG